MESEQKRRVLSDIADASKAAARADARLDGLYAEARKLGATFREIADATDGRVTHQTIANRIAKGVPMRTLTIDATAGAVQAVMADLWPGQMHPGTGGGAYVEVTLPGDKADALTEALAASGYNVF